MTNESKELDFQWDTLSTLEAYEIVQSVRHQIFRDFYDEEAVLEYIVRRPQLFNPKIVQYADTRLNNLHWEREEQDAYGTYLF